MGDENFKVILLGVVFDPKTRKILIGRIENDPEIPELSWVFPGGHLNNSEDLDKVLKNKIKEKTGYDVKNLGTIFSKVYPEKEDLLAVYFLCEVFEGEEKAGGDITELKWVNPEELESHFTTSFHSRLKEYIMNLK
tara:strand:+ start:11241 stop:11648 length:408 start_codon:yes stop_codon:yes gene_type:complete